MSDLALRSAFATMKAVAVAPFLLLAAACSAAPPAPPLDKSHMKLTFEETFAKPPSFYNRDHSPHGRWKTNFFFSIQPTDDPRGWEARTLRPNKELEYYGDPAKGMNPFEWQPGKFTIVAIPNPFARDPITHGLPYLSGVITTEKSFTQQYGYFEMRVTMPVGKGLWPAFWLLPEAKMIAGVPTTRTQQEIDIFENIGDPDKVYMTVHRDVNGKKVGDGGPIPVMVAEPHDYGLLWTPTDVVWYIDGKEVRRRPNVDFHMPAYILINLAVGGTWPGSPDATTPFPARMTIDWVRAYALDQKAGT